MGFYGKEEIEHLLFLPRRRPAIRSFRIVEGVPGECPKRSPELQSNIMRIFTVDIFTLEDFCELR